MANEPLLDAQQQREAKRYARLRLSLHILEFLLSVILLVAFYFAGGSHALATFANKLGANVWGAVAVYVIAMLTGASILTLPLSYIGGFWIEHRFNLSNQKFGSWLWDEAKSFALSLAFITIVAEAVYALLRATGAWWWLWAAVFMTAFTLLVSFIVPVVIIPMFYKLKPLDDESLAGKLRTMAERVGARVVGVFQIELGAKTKKANAAFAGFGKTRRILLGDTLLSNFSVPEIEVVLAHELAHFRFHDIWKGLALSTVATVIGFWLCDVCLRAAVGDDLANIEHLPLFVLVMMVFAFVTSPISHAWSRRAEYRADWFALDMTRDPDGFVSAMKKLASQNLADLEPHPVVEFLFHDHPALSKRIAKGEVWRQAAAHA